MFTQLLTALAPARIVSFDLTAMNLHMLDLSIENKELASLDLLDTAEFNRYVQDQISTHRADAALGAYDEDRIIYRRSSLFDDAEPRCIHIGIDVWIDAGTPVITPLDARVHSFQDNSAYGDYGPTVLLEHITDGVKWFTLYGHLSRKSLEGLGEGMDIPGGTPFAWVGSEGENGQWPSHLHFQVIRDLEGRRGDYPGVCAPSRRDHYLSNCPNPLLLLGLQV